MKTTFWKLTTIFMAVLCLSVFGAALSPAERPENPGGGPPDDTGPPVVMEDVRGCAYFDEVLAVWRLREPTGAGGCYEPADTDPKIDFGPEGYCPDPCLTGDLITDQLNGTKPVEIKIGKNLVGTFKWSSEEEDAIILAQTDADGLAYKAGYDFIPLLPAEGTDYGRPQDGKWVRVFGRAGETEYAVLAWEIRYNWLPNDYGNWYWWRTSGQPWAKMWLLDCESPGEEEEPSSSKGGGGGGNGNGH